MLRSVVAASERVANSALDTFVTESTGLTTRK